MTPNRKAGEVAVVFLDDPNENKCNNKAVFDLFSVLIYLHFKMVKMLWL